MDPAKYFHELSNELNAVRDRVRNLIGDVHWPSDGAWKESVIRAVVRRYLPPSMTVGTGFFITPDGVSQQIDMLICDDSAPFLFRDGDFLIATADCVRAIVEVKTSICGDNIRSEVRKLNKLSELMRARRAWPSPFIGLFSYEPTSTDPREILDFLTDENGAKTVPPIRALCFGPAQFFRFWHFNPKQADRLVYDAWHAYDLPNKAAGYFVHNLIESLYPDAFERAGSMWYPEASKEPQVLGRSRPRA